MSHSGSDGGGDGGSEEESEEESELENVEKRLREVEVIVCENE